MCFSLFRSPFDWCYISWRMFLLKFCFVTAFTSYIQFASNMLFKRSLTVQKQRFRQVKIAPSDVERIYILISFLLSKSMNILFAPLYLQGSNSNLVFFCEELRTFSYGSLMFVKLLFQCYRPSTLAKYINWEITTKL